MIRRRRWHRIVFRAAGTYNLTWGTWTVLDPQWLFRFADMPPLNHPAIFACLGMAIGLYSILYWEVARAPEHGWLIAAVGLTGKVLGPLGMAWLIGTGEWPAAAGILCVGNDLIWWAPFAVYLWDASFPVDFRVGKSEPALPAG